MKKYARPALAGVAVVVLALLLWWAHRPAKPRPLVEGELGLLVLENGDEPGGIRTQRLLRYPVKGGEVGTPEVVWTGDVDFFRHWGQNPTRIVEGRYVVTRQGGVLDLTSGKVIFGGTEHFGSRQGEVRAVAGGKVYFRYRDTVLPSPNTIFDLATATVRTGEDPPGRWFLPGLQSPDGTKSVVNEWGGSQIILHRVGQEPAPLGDDFHVSYSVNSSTHGKPPMLWLDNDRLLTQIGNGKLVVVTVDVGTRTGPLDVPATTEIVSAPYLWRDAEGGVIYECGRGAILIDADARRWSRYVWHRLGHGFELSLGHEVERAIRYDGRTIGRFDVTYGSEAATDGHVAVQTSDPGTGRRVRVWSAASEQWTVLEVNCDRVIGWVK